MSKKNENSYSTLSISNNRLSNPSDEFQDMTGHELLSPKLDLQHAFWGDTAGGGGVFIAGQRRDATYNGITTRALYFRPLSTKQNDMFAKIKCTCKSKAQLKFGIIDVSSSAYFEVGTCRIEGPTEAKFSAGLDLIKNEEFLILLEQTLDGGATHPIKIFGSNQPKLWGNTISFYAN